MDTGRCDPSNNSNGPPLDSNIEWINSLNYKTVQLMATERKLPANLKKLDMARLIALRTIGAETELNLLLNNLKEVRSRTRQIARHSGSSSSIPGYGTTTAEADSASASPDHDDEEDLNTIEDELDEDYDPHGRGKKSSGLRSKMAGQNRPPSIRRSSYDMASPPPGSVPYGSPGVPPRAAPGAPPCATPGAPSGTPSGTPSAASSGAPSGAHPGTSLVGPPGCPPGVAPSMAVAVHVGTAPSATPSTAAPSGGVGPEETPKPKKTNYRRPSGGSSGSSCKKVSKGGRLYKPRRDAGYVYNTKMTYPPNTLSYQAAPVPSPGLRQGVPFSGSSHESPQAASATGGFRSHAAYGHPSAPAAAGSSLASSVGMSSWPVSATVSQQTLPSLHPTAHSYSRSNSQAGITKHYNVQPPQQTGSRPMPYPCPLPRYAELVRPQFNASSVQSAHKNHFPINQSEMQIPQATEFKSHNVVNPPTNYPSNFFQKGNEFSPMANIPNSNPLNIDQTVTEPHSRVFYPPPLLVGAHNVKQQMYQQVSRMHKSSQLASGVLPTSRLHKPVPLLLSAAVPSTQCPASGYISANLEWFVNVRSEHLRMPVQLSPYWKPAKTKCVDSYTTPICFTRCGPGLYQEATHTMVKEIISSAPFYEDSPFQPITRAPQQPIAYGNPANLGYEVPPSNTHPELRQYIAEHHIPTQPPIQYDMHKMQSSYHGFGQGPTQHQQPPIQQYSSSFHEQSPPAVPDNYQDPRGWNPHEQQYQQTWNQERNDSKFAHHQPYTIKKQPKQVPAKFMVQKKRPYQQQCHPQQVNQHLGMDGQDQYYQQPQPSYQQQLNHSPQLSVEHKQGPPLKKPCYQANQGAGNHPRWSVGVSEEIPPLNQSHIKSTNSQQLPFSEFRGQNNQLSFPLIYDYLTSAEKQVGELQSRQGAHMDEKPVFQPTESLAHQSFSDNGAVISSSFIEDVLPTLSQHASVSRLQGSTEILNDRTMSSINAHASFSSEAQHLSPMMQVCQVTSLAGKVDAIKNSPDSSMMLSDEVMPINSNLEEKAAAVEYPALSPVLMETNQFVEKSDCSSYVQLVPLPIESNQFDETESQNYIPHITRALTVPFASAGSACDEIVVPDHIDTTLEKVVKDGEKANQVVFLCSDGKGELEYMTLSVCHEDALNATSGSLPETLPATPTTSDLGLNLIETEEVNDQTSSHPSQVSTMPVTNSDNSTETAIAEEVNDKNSSHPSQASTIPVANGEVATETPDTGELKNQDSSHPSQVSTIPVTDSDISTETASSISDYLSNASSLVTISNSCLSSSNCEYAQVSSPPLVIKGRSYLESDIVRVINEGAASIVSFRHDLVFSSTSPNETSPEVDKVTAEQLESTELEPNLVTTPNNTLSITDIRVAGESESPPASEKPSEISLIGGPCDFGILDEGVKSNVHESLSVGGENMKLVADDSRRKSGVEDIVEPVPSVNLNAPALDCAPQTNKSEFENKLQIEQGQAGSSREQSNLGETTTECDTSLNLSVPSNLQDGPFLERDKPVDLRKDDVIVKSAECQPMDKQLCLGPAASVIDGSSETSEVSKNSNDKKAMPVPDLNMNTILSDDNSAVVDEMPDVHGDETPLYAGGEIKEEGIHMMSPVLRSKSAGKTYPGKQARQPVRSSPRVSVKASPSYALQMSSSLPLHLESSLQQPAKGRKSCPNEDNGCPLVLPPAQLSSHHLVCEYTLVECPSIGCGFKCVAKKLSAHVRDVHRQAIGTGTDSQHNVSVHQLEQQQRLTFFREVSRKLFVVCIHAHGNNIYASIQYIASGRAEKPVTAKGTLEVILDLGGGFGTPRAWVGKIGPIQQRLDVVRESGNCLQVTSECLGAVRDKTIAFHANIRVNNHAAAMAQSVSDPLA